MSDFMKWLYQHYVRPELEAAEYIALQAFQLGLRAGRDLCC